ncbi:hypothetical protein HMPREF1640_09165 [Prevotella sp. S7-1-8]|nr:hypothetical protein HMPREF1640_09165 [Prevotella sp. S7-1-8]
MVSSLTLIICTLLFTAIGAIWIVGYNYVKKHCPANLPQFYMILAVARIVSILAFVGIYILFISKSAAESRVFALMVILMYIVMMGVSLKIKH